MTKIPVCVIAGQGRMGKAIVQAISLGHDNHTTSLDMYLELASVYVRDKTLPDTAENDCMLKSSGQDSKKHATTSDLNAAITAATVVIDFSSPELSMQVLKICCEKKKLLVIGTTGFSELECQTITDESNQIPILFSSNMSLGVNILFALTTICSKILAKSKQSWQTEIIEIHHRKKKDKPSGTAIELARKIDPDFFAVQKSTEAQLSAISHQGLDTIHSLRVGNVIGEHSVFFYSGQERLVLEHQAHSRKIFADGAILGAKLLYQEMKNRPGVYSMQKLLNLEQLFASLK